METKVCTKCGEEKPATTEHFAVGRRYLLGVRPRCKSCDKECRRENKEEIALKNKRYYENNKEELAPKRKRYRENNKEKKALYDRRYRENNKEELALKQRRYRENNKEKLALKKKRYRENNKEAIALKQKRYRENNKEALALKQRRYQEKNKEEISLKKKRYRENNKEALALKQKCYRENNKEALALKQKCRHRNLPAGVYKITNKKTNAIYIGASTRLPIRWSTHKWYLRKEQHSNINLQEDYNKYGLEAFEFEVLEEHPPETQFEALEKIEQKTIKRFLAAGKKLYNRTVKDK